VVHILYYLQIIEVTYIYLHVYICLGYMKSTTCLAGNKHEMKPSLEISPVNMDVVSDVSATRS
jgi:hypothetical protein